MKAASLAKTFVEKESMLKDLKGNAQFVHKVTFEPLMDFKHNYFTEVGNITKAAASKSFLHLIIKTHNCFFCDSAFLIFS